MDRLAGQQVSILGTLQARNRKTSMYSRPPASLINGVIVLTIGFLLTGCGFIAVTSEEYSREEALQIHQYLPGNWFLSLSCHWAGGLEGLSCTEYSEEDSPIALSFFADSSVTYFTWDEDGLPLEYHTSYTIEFRVDGRRPTATLLIPGQGAYIVSRMSDDHFSMDQVAKDGFGFTYRRF